MGFEGNTQGSERAWSIGLLVKTVWKRSGQMEEKDWAIGMDEHLTIESVCYVFRRTHDWAAANAITIM